MRVVRSKLHRWYMQKQVVHTDVQVILEYEFRLISFRQILVPNLEEWWCIYSSQRGVATCPIGIFLCSGWGHAKDHWSIRSPPDPTLLQGGVHASKCWISIPLYRSVCAASNRSAFRSSLLQQSLKKYCENLIHRDFYRVDQINWFGTKYVCKL